jgi:hypothetical protein
MKTLEFFTVWDSASEKFEIIDIRNTDVNELLRYVLQAHQYKNFEVYRKNLVNKRDMLTKLITEAQKSFDGTVEATDRGLEQ